MKLNRKIHKPRNEDGRYPWRAYVSGIGTATESVAGLVEFELNEGVKKLDSYVEDSSHFLRLIEDLRLAPDKFMYTMDVVKLYPSVPREGGREAMLENLERRTDKTIRTRDLLELAELVLQNNEITFHERKALQIDGTAIGSKLGKNYACAYMGKWEEMVVGEAQVRGMQTPRRHYRFVDDIFGTWKGSVHSFLEFVNLCNEIEPRIKITHNICMKEAVFLDVKIIRKESGEVKTRVHIKDTDRQRYLHMKSDHPEHTKRGIAKGQMRRLRRICSEPGAYLAILIWVA
jgi:hypothetical protein